MDFRADELAGYLHFVHRIELRLRALTSREALGSGEIRIASARRFQEVLSTFRERGLKDIEVRVMPNKEGEPVLHDRFLVVDGAVWFSGNSFNAIGKRESLLVKLPDPSPVIERLNSIFDRESDDISSFLQPAST